MDELIKQESSIPISARVSLISLANIAVWWENRGYIPGNMSQLISWSMDLLLEKIRNAGEGGDIESVTVAHSEMVSRGLYQNSLKNRSMKKVSTAIRFESMREEGLDPAEVNRDAYNVLHNKRSVTPSPGGLGGYSAEELKTIADKAWKDAKLKKQQEEYEKRKALKDAKASGIIVDDDWLEERRRKEQDIRDRENQPLDFDELKKNLPEE